MLNHKGSADRVRSARQVVEVINVQGEVLDAGLRKALDADVAIQPLLDAIAARIDTAASALQAASEAHEAELDDDHGVRADRDARVEAVYAAVIDARQSIRGAYGAGALKAIGQAGTLARRPDRILTAGKALIEKAPPVLSETVARPGMTVDVDGLLAPARAAMPALEAALAAVDREAREAALTLNARNRASDAHDAAFTQGASALSALFRLAGEPELAKRVRPSRRRAGEVAMFDGEPEIEDDEADLPEG